MRVLYVDDDRINLLLFSAACEELDTVECECAESAAAALARAVVWQPQFLVLDLHLGSHTGFELLNSLRQLHGLATTPAVLCSADASPALLAEAQAQGFAACWPKPVTAAQLQLALAALIRQSELTAQE